MFLLIALLSATVFGSVATAGGLVASALLDPQILLLTAGSMAAMLIATTIRTEEQ